MHRLNRGDAPACLGRYQHGRNTWRDLTSEDRAEIWQALEAMQGQRCAYCESQLTADKRHIEHFVPRSRYPQHTFDWGNLFGSCDRQDSCGHHKDRKGKPYDDADLLKPDVDDPDHYLIFVSDGTIKVRQHLNDYERRRASETLRVFNLDAEGGALRHMRRSAVAGYLQTAEELWSLKGELPEQEWQELLQAELDAMTNQPFVTAIRHTLCALS